PRIRQNMKLVRTAAAYRSGICGYCPKPQSQAGEYSAVGIMHCTVSFLQTDNAGMERIRIFHYEFTRPHYSKARADLIAEFGLNLIKNKWQPTITLYLPPHNVGNDFFVRGAKAEIALMPILDFQHLGTKNIPTPSFLP